MIVNDVSIGALNRYGEDAKAFDPDSERLAERFARQGSATLANAEIHERTVIENRKLRDIAAEIMNDASERTDNEPTG